MNKTNRFLNRLLLLIVGIVSLALGAGVLGLVLVAYGALPDATLTGLSQQAEAMGSTLTLSTPILYIVAIIAGILALLLLLSAFRHGGGGIGYIRDSATGKAAHDGTRIDIKFARDLLEADLRAQPEFVGASVGAYEVKQAPMLKIQVRGRRGLSPVVARDVAIRSLRDFDAVMGEELPVLVIINGGFRFKHSKMLRG